MTGNSCLLDTSVIVNAFKDNSIAGQLNSFSELFIPLTAVGELYYGAYHSTNVKKHLDKMHQFFQNCIILTPDVSTADYYGNIKNSLKNKGKMIPENDFWIAAIAVQYSLPLFTADKHFPVASTAIPRNLMN